MTEWVYFNGNIVPAGDARVSIDDRGFLFADAIYEVVHVYGETFFAWDRHMARLQHGLSVLRFPPIDPKPLADAARQLRGRVAAPEAQVYLEISRGAQPRSHLFPPATTPPTVLLWVRPVDPIPAEVVARGIAAITVPDDRWAKVWIKTVSLLPNVLAKEAARAAGAFEAIFVRDGMVTEATSANVFIVREGCLETAPVTNYILPGVTRAVVLELASELGVSVRERPFTVAEMQAADEVFLTGTLTEVLPVTTIDGMSRGVGGPMARTLLEALRRRAGQPS